MRDHEIADLLCTQAGVISYEQARLRGLTRSQVRHRERIGSWTRVERGVYRVEAFPHSEMTRLWVAILALRGIASHRSAAQLHGFNALGRQQAPEIVVAHGRWRRINGVTVHQSTQLDRIDQVAVHGVPCTGRGRTVLDLGVSMPAARLGKVVDDLLRKNLITQAELWDVLIRHSVQGRDGCGPLRVVLEERRGQARIALSDWSYGVANLLESAGLDRPELEFRAHANDGTLLGQIDLAYPHAMLAIELDSIEFHNNLDSFHSDRARARQLTVEGWTVLQFTWKDYSKRSDQLISQVRKILSRPMAA